MTSKTNNWQVPETNQKLSKAFKEGFSNKLTQIGMPSSQQEVWKYINTDCFTNDETITTTQKSEISDRYETFDRIDVNREHLTSSNAVKTINYALHQLSEDQAKDLETTINTFDVSDNQLIHLNHANLDYGVMITVPKGVEIDTPVAIHFNETETVSHPLLYINVESGAKGKFLIQNYSQLPYNFVAYLNVEEGASLEVYQDKTDQAETVSFETVKAKVASNATIHVGNIFTGGSLHRLDIDVELNGENITCDIGGVGILTNNNVSHIKTNVSHLQPSCNSMQRYHQILNHKSTAEFTGRIYVRDNAQLTDAAQQNKNLLLSDGARAIARPQLEIFADDVECAHGSNTGQLDNDQLFYLKSRGIAEYEAKTILMKGFVQEGIDTIYDESIQEIFSNRLDDLLKDGE